MHVNIELKNGDILTNCYIYIDKLVYVKGDTYLAERADIDEAFQIVPDDPYKRGKFVNFQNKYISGKVPVQNVKGYWFV